MDHVKYTSPFHIIFCPYNFPSSHRAFRINELKTEVTNRLAMLEKRVECKSYILYSVSERILQESIITCDNTKLNT